jgi:ComF family protein
MALIGNKSMTVIKKIKDVVLDLIFPRECLSCGKEGSYLCADCFKKIETNNKFYCVVCKRPTDYSKICQTCQSEYKLRAIWVAANYNDKILQELIHFLKYKYIEEAGDILAEIIIKYLEKNQILQKFGLSKSSALFVPVPLHKKRYLSRGFNQSDLLVKKVSEFYKIPKADILARKRNTQSQIDLRKSERQENVKGAFEMINKDNLDKNKKIILIDDVVTTGSTLNECAKVLLDAGLSEIYGLVVAQRED